MERKKRFPSSTSLRHRLPAVPSSSSSLVMPSVPDPLEHKVLAALNQLPRPLALPDGAPPHDRVVVRVGHADDALGERAGDDDGGLGGAPGGVEPVLVEEVLARGLGEELIAGFLFFFVACGGWWWWVVEGVVVSALSLSPSLPLLALVRGIKKSPSLSQF